MAWVDFAACSFHAVPTGLSTKILEFLLLPRFRAGMSFNDTPVIWLNVAKRVRTRKVVDEIDQVRCKSGSHGVIREEVYVDDAGALVKYNLVFIHRGLCQQDNGRVLGYDNAHGHHERHWMGEQGTSRLYQL